jgi:phenol 2-monooxygenase (NADPH)
MSPYPENSHSNGKLRLHLGKIEELLLTNIQDTRGITVERGKTPLRINTRLDCKEFPIEALIKKEFEEGKIELAPVLLRSKAPFKVSQNGISHENGPQCKQPGVEILRAKHVIGCDGAHSWTRKHFGMPFLGQVTDLLWGEYGDHRRFTD